MKQLLHCQYTTNANTGWHKIKILANSEQEARQKLENCVTDIINFKVTKKEMIIV